MRILHTYTFTDDADMQAEAERVKTEYGYEVLNIHTNEDGTGVLESGEPDYMVLNETTKELTWDQNAYDEENEEEVLREDNIVKTLTSATFAQIDTWMDNNVTNLAEAKLVLNRLVKLMKVLLMRLPKKGAGLKHYI